MQRFVSRGTTAAFLAAALAGCAATPQTHVDRGPAADLRSYRSFGWTQPLAGTRGDYAGLLMRQLQSATRTALERQGYVYDEVDPDLRVNLVAGVAERVALRSVPGRLSRGVDSVDVRRGTLVIDLVDARRRALVWRGVAEGELDQDALRSPGTTASQAVETILAELPR